MKKTLAILTLFLLLMMPFTVLAGEGSVRVLDTEGNNITDHNFEESDEDNESEDVGNEVSETSTQEDDEGVLAILQTAGENALTGFTEGIIDALFEGAVTIFETDVNTEEDGTTTYDIQVKELHPYEHPLVLPVQLITFCFLILITIITILGSMILTAFQTKHPETYGDLKRSISGEYRPYNPSRVHAACVWSITRPVLYLIGFVSIIFGRNYLLTTLPQTASGMIGSSDNIVISGITAISIFVGSFQTSAGEYGVYAFGTLLFVTCMITDFLVLFNKSDTAKQLENIAWGSFLLFCFCDLINMFCTSFGVITSQWRNEDIFVTVGIVSGGFINFLILASLTIYAVLKLKKISGV